MFDDQDSDYRNYRDYQTRRDQEQGGNSDLFSELVEIIAVPALLLFLGLGLTWAGIGWVDSQLGWGVQDWISDLIAQVRS